MEFEGQKHEAQLEWPPSQCRRSAPSPLERHGVIGQTERAPYDRIPLQARHAGPHAILHPTTFRQVTLGGQPFLACKHPRVCNAAGDPKVIGIAEATEALDERLRRRRREKSCCETTVIAVAKRGEHGVTGRADYRCRRARKPGRPNRSDVVGAS